MSVIQPAIYDAAVQVLQGHQPAALCTVVRVEGSVPGKLGAKMLVYPDGSQLGTVGGAGLEQKVRARALAAIASGQGGTDSYVLAKWAPDGLNSICGGTAEVYVEVLTPPPHLLLCGGGHVAQAIAALCGPLEYRFSILDDRPEFTTPELFPAAVQRYTGTPDTLFPGLDLAPYSAIYLLGYSWEVDTALLTNILPVFDGYVGLIGSKTKNETTSRELANAGLRAADIAKLACPIGFPIGAETPAEIAIAILAELIQRLKQGTSASGAAHPA